jgi:hypothetical protein
MAAGAALGPGASAACAFGSGTSHTSEVTSVPDFTTYQNAVLHTMALLGLVITAVAAFLFIIALWDIFGEMHWGNTWEVWFSS